MVVAVAVLVQVALEVLGAHRVIDTRDSALNEAPEPFDGVRVGVARHVDFDECWMRLCSYPEPQMQACRRLVKDRASGGVDVVPALWRTSRTADS